MSHYQTKDYVPEITANPNWKKCFSPANLDKLLDFLIERQLIPSQVSTNRALAELKFRRTDGGSAATDAQAAKDAAQQQLDAAIAEAYAPPLTLAELEYFQGLSFPDLQRLYWANDRYSTFRVRYDKGVNERGYRAPARPRVQEGA